MNVAPLHYRALQRLRRQILNHSHIDYNRVGALNEECKEELTWWIQEATEANGHSVVLPSVNLTISTDAPKTGWGASDQITSTQEVWTKMERREHINILEMRAVQVALKAMFPWRKNLL